jgi:hypothetical protein
MAEIQLNELLPSELRRDINSSERLLLKKSNSRAPAVFASSDKENTPSIRAEFLYWLCTDPDADRNIHPKGTWLEGATVEGVLDFEGATLRHPLWLVNCVIPEEIVLRDAVTKSIKLSGSHTGQISAQRLRASGFLELKRIRSNGRVSLSDADIVGNLNCEGAAIVIDGRRQALRANRVCVRGDVVIKEMKTQGSVSFTGANIGGKLDCDRAVINPAKGEVALKADRLAVGSLSLRHFQAHGTVRLVGAKVAGDLNCDHASFLGADEYSLYARNLTVTGTFFCRHLSKKPAGVIQLLHARVGQLTDDIESWPDAGKLVLDGFVYELFGPHSPQSAAQRLRWIGLQRGDHYSPHPYEQLAKVFRSTGREVEAREVLIAKQEARRKQSGLNRRTKAWLWFLGKSIRYGYEPWRLIGFMICMVLVGWGVFSMADMKSTSDFAPQFNPFIYSLEVFVPVVDLHQERYYLPSGKSLYGSWFRTYFWLHIILGWIATTLLVAALTGLIRRD